MLRGAVEGGGGKGLRHPCVPQPCTQQACLSAPRPPCRPTLCQRGGQALPSQLWTSRRVRPVTVTVRAERAREGGEAAGETCTRGPRPGGLGGDPSSRSPPVVFPGCSRTTDRETGVDGGRAEGRWADGR